MRFFVSGSVQSKQGPRQILAAALGMLLLFTLCHALREGLHLGLSLESIRNELHRSSTLLGPRTPLALIEEIHIDLLLFGMVLLLLGALIYHLPLRHTIRTGLFFACALLICLYPTAKVLTYFHTTFAALTLTVGILLHVFLVLLIFSLFIFLFSKNERA